MALSKKQEWMNISKSAGRAGLAGVLGVVAKELLDRGIDIQSIIAVLAVFGVPLGWKIYDPNDKQMGRGKKQR